MSQAGEPRERPILIVEDDPTTSSLVSLYLEREGFRTLCADRGTVALELARRKNPRFVILDLMLPEVDGWQICRQLRQHSNVPILILTAREDEMDRIRGFTLGADDYVVKPFSPGELVARVKAILRRTAQGPARSTLHAAGLVLDPIKHQVTLEGKPVALTPSEFTILRTLMQSPGRAFRRSELLDRLYPGGETVVDRVVDVHVGKLRQKIEPDPVEPRYIETVRGIGYRFLEPLPGPGTSP